MASIFASGHIDPYCTPLQKRQVHDSLADVQGGEGGLPQAGSKPGGYVPPSKRGGGGGEGDSMRRREENSVRVTNLSEDTREDDLRVGAPPLQSLRPIWWCLYGQGVLFVHSILNQMPAWMLQHC